MGVPMVCHADIIVHQWINETQTWMNEGNSFDTEVRIFDVQQGMPPACSSVARKLWAPLRGG